MKIKAETIIRTVVLVVALVNQILTATGHSVLPFTDDMISQTISLAFTIGAAAWAWWKNNSFTQAALKADQVLNKLKESDNESGSDDEGQ